MEDSTYEAPELRIVGSVHELTQQEFDKVGTSLDAASFVIPGLTGVIQPDPGPP